MASTLALLLYTPVTLAASVPKCCPESQALELHTKACTDREDTGEHSVSLVREGLNLTLASLYSEAAVEAWDMCPTSSSYLLSKFKLLKRSNQYILVDVINKAVRKAYCLDSGHNSKTGSAGAVAKVCEPCQDPGRPCINFYCQQGKVGRGCKPGVEDLTWLTMDFTRITVPLHCTSPHHYTNPDLFNMTDKGMFIDGEVRHFSEYNIFYGENPTATIYFCNRQYDPRTHGVIKIVFLCLSLTSLLILILLHIFIQELWRRHFTKLQVSFFSSTFMSFLFLLISQMEETESIAGLCVFLGLMVQYWSLAMFLWLTAMSRSIWGTFRAMVNPLSQERQARQLRERRWASTISFGLPLLLLVVTLGMELLGDPEATLHPGLSKSCFLAQYWPQFIYFHLPLLLLLSTNLFLYSLLVFKFSCGLWSSSEQDSSKVNWRNLRVVLEFFFFMGIYWLPESLGFFISWKDKTNWNHVTLVVLQHFNQLAGLWILGAFLAKGKNREMIRERLLPSRRPDGETEMTTQQSNLSTQQSNLSTQQSRMESVKR